MTGYIKLFRQIKRWEWYTDIPTKTLFIHLLLSANHEAQEWRGIKIEKGQLITSLSHLAQECGLTIKQVRTSLKKLNSSKNVASKGQAQYTVISIKNWDKFQAEGKQRASQGQSEGKQRATNKKIENEENEEKSFFLRTHAHDKKEGKKQDPYIHPIKRFFMDEYAKVFNTKPFLSAQDLNRLVELSAEHPDIRELLIIAINKLKAIEFKDIDYKPSASWLLKGNNFERVMNGEFEKKTELNWIEKALQEENTC